MKAKLLNLEQSLQMYGLIQEFLDVSTDMAKLPTIIGGKKYVEVLQLLTGEDKETILKAPQEERLIALLEGFKNNQLLDLPRLKVDGLHG